MIQIMKGWYVLLLGQQEIESEVEIHGGFASFRQGHGRRFLPCRKEQEHHPWK